MKKAEKIIDAAVVPYEEKALASYEITPEEVARKAKEYMALKVLPEDAKSYQVARSALTMCVSTRTSVDKRRKELGEDSRKWVAAVNQAAKDLLAPLAPAEDHLRGELDLEDGRRKEVKAEKERIEKARIDGIKAKITSISSNILLIRGKDSQALMTMLDNVSTIQIDGLYQEFEAEARKALDDVKATLNLVIVDQVNREIQEATQKEEAARLAKQREEQEAIEKAQAEERRKLKEAQDKLEAEKKEADELRWKSRFSLLKGALWRPTREDAYDSETGDVIAAKAQLLSMTDDDFEKLQRNWNKIIADREAAIALAKKKAEEEFERKAKERAEAEARAKVEREAAEKKAREEAEAKAKAEREAKEAEEKARQEALKPDKEKLIAYGFALTCLPTPDLSDKAAQKILKRFYDQLQKAVTEMNHEAEAL